jgi:hypothetical protein
MYFLSFFSSLMFVNSFNVLAYRCDIWPILCNALIGKIKNEMNTFPVPMCKPRANRNGRPSILKDIRRYGKAFIDGGIGLHKDRSPGLASGKRAMNRIRCYRRVTLHAAPFSLWKQLNFRRITL